MASGDKKAIPAMAAGFKAFDGEISKGTGDTLSTPEAMLNIGGNGYGFVLDAQTDWDPTANDDGTAGSLALGDDVYVYAVRDASGKATLVASKNTTVPDGETADTSRKIGGFHYGRVRPIADAYNAGASLATQIIPNSVWDLQHRPKCDPTGMVEIIPGALWMDIYLASEDGTSWPDTIPLSAYNATPLTGDEGYNIYYDYIRLCRNAGKRLPTYTEWIAAAYGVPQGATGNGSRQNTGDHSGYGFEAVSSLNIDQPAGNVYQTLEGVFDRRHDADGWNDDLNTGKDGGNDHGQWCGSEMRVYRAGGSWSHGAEAGARCVNRNNPWNVNSNNGLRAACDPHGPPKTMTANAPHRGDSSGIGAAFRLRDEERSTRRGRK